MQDKENMEQFFDDSWEHMHGLLDEHFPVKEKKKWRLTIWWWSGLALALLALGIMLWFDNQPVTPTKVPQNNPIPKKAIAQDEQIAEKKSETLDVTPTVSDATANPSKKENSPLILKINKSQKIKFAAGKPISQYDNFKSVSAKSEEAIINDIEHRKAKDSESMKKTSQLSSIEEKRPSVFLIPSLPLLAPNPLATEAAELKGVIKKNTGKKFYFEVYTGASQSNLGYNAGYIGFDIGRSLTNRLSVELGLGYRTILSGKTYIDSTAKALDFSADKLEYTFEPASIGSGIATIGSKESLRLHLVELPLKLRYRLTPKWAVYGEAIGVYQFAKPIPDAVPNNITIEKTYLPVSKLTAHAYLGLGGGISFGKNHWRLNAGYNNWALFRPDHQYYLGLKYRF